MSKSKRSITHTGRQLYRTKQNPLEEILSRGWVKVNNPPKWLNGGHGILELLLHSDGDGNCHGDLTQEEATVAATVVQWLGSPVGFSWLQETLGRKAAKVKA